MPKISRRALLTGAAAAAVAPALPAKSAAALTPLRVSDIIVPEIFEGGFLIPQEYQKDILHWLSSGVHEINVKAEHFVVVDSSSEISDGHPVKTPLPQRKERKMPTPKILEKDKRIAQEISDMLARGEDVNIPGVGKLSVIQKAARMGRNPMTGEPVEISARKVLKLSMSKAMKDRLAGA